MPYPLRRDGLIVCVCLIVAAVGIDFGQIHRYHTADSVVMSLVSLYQWTPLYWEQDRLGMLFPLLATPWRHPLDNLLALGAMTTVAGLSSFFLLGCYAVGASRGIAAGALAAIFLIGFCRVEQQFEHLVMLQQNAQALAIGIGGLLLLDRWARSVGRWAVQAAWPRPIGSTRASLSSSPPCWPSAGCVFEDWAKRSSSSTRRGPTG